MSKQIDRDRQMIRVAMEPLRRRLRCSESIRRAEKKILLNEIEINAGLKRAITIIHDLLALAYSDGLFDEYIFGLAKRRAELELKKILYPAKKPNQKHELDGISRLCARHLREKFADLKQRFAQCPGSSFSKLSLSEKLNSVQLEMVRRGMKFKPFISEVRIEVG